MLMKIEAIKYVMQKINRIGMNGSFILSLSGIMHPIKRKAIQVVVTEMASLAININTQAIELTIENLTEFLRIRRKAFTAELQKPSEDIAM